METPLHVDLMKSPIQSRIGLRSGCEVRHGVMEPEMDIEMDMEFISIVWHAGTESCSKRSKCFYIELMSRYIYIYTIMKL